MDASYKIQRGIHVHLIQFFMCPEFWVHIIPYREPLRFLCQQLVQNRLQYGNVLLELGVKFIAQRVIVV